MSDLEDEVKVLREKNNELVQKVQYWKMTAAQRENEKLELMKEINQLRLKLSRMRSGGAAQARKLDASLQATSEEALSHLVQASSAVARTIELTKQYIQDRQESEAVCPRWSTLSAATPERVNKVPPLLLGGRSIQPVVQLRRTSLNTARNNLRSPNQTRNVTERAVPMHMLQDVYIPLTRIDTSNYPINYMETEPSGNDVNNSTEELGLPEEINEQSMEDNNSSDDEEYDNSRRLDAVTEDVEPESDEPTPQRIRVDNPLEGPSWLLDVPNAMVQFSRSGIRAALEPDSTTELNDSSQPANRECSNDVKMEFTPTVRRRKRTASPTATPEPTDGTVGSRVLKVLLPKLSLQESPPRNKRAAPSPHGATDHTLIVLVSPEHVAGGDASTSSPCIISTPRPSRDGHNTSHTPHNTEQPNPPYTENIEDCDNSGQNQVKTEPNQVNGEVNGSGDSGGMGDASDRNMVSARRGGASWMFAECADSDSSDLSDRGAELRTRRKRKPVTYTEKPLNRKMRR